MEYSITEIKTKACQLTDSKDYVKALEWYEMGAQLDDGECILEAADIASILSKTFIMVLSDYKEAALFAQKASHWCKIAESKGIDSHMKIRFYMNLGQTYYYLGAKATDQEVRKAYFVECYNTLLEVTDSFSEKKEIGLIWALAVQYLQDMGFEFRDVVINEKVRIYVSSSTAYFDAIMQSEKGEALLSSMFIDLGYMYLDGVEIEGDFTKAHDCFLKAYEFGISGVKQELDNFVLRPDGTYIYLNS